MADKTNDKKLVQRRTFNQLTKFSNMAGLKGLVDTSASCGAVNPLMKLTSHVSKDQGKSDFTKYTKKGNFKRIY